MHTLTFFDFQVTTWLMTHLSCHPFTNFQTLHTFCHLTRTNGFKKIWLFTWEEYCAAMLATLYFKPFEKFFPDHIPHTNSKYMKQKSEIVPLGLLFKNEQHNEDMVDILGHFNQYVPTTMDQKGIAEQVLFGGDQLTAERTRSAKALQLNARTEHGQLHGLVPFIEDWHALQCMLQVAWMRFYRSDSESDTGTLHQLRNYIQRRNVKAALDHFKMPSMDSHRMEHAFHSTAAQDQREKEMESYIKKQCRALVHRHVFPIVTQMTGSASVTPCTNSTVFLLWLPWMSQDISLQWSGFKTSP
ncbi:uncharacterized protein LOC134195039 isoform X2 [Corticium candelabrum]|uniref:uncharacterized protein LOC134195039 isoform X2 n=1 Tax=Corticium candelabrum TaxID=121492 RepID=UPI002E2528A9|nr:uncharacterized protein LOC134195039 isoform X2 [Corticium candelabrum]